MKAAVIYRNGGPEVLEYEEVPDPTCPDGCVLVDVAIISVEGGDLLHRAGSPPPSTPHVVGYVAAGTIAEVGDGVEGLAVGDRVVTMGSDGSHADKRVVPGIAAFAIPDGLEYAEAACVPVAVATAQECLFNAGNLEAGETVLVQAGAGGVGMAAIQLAKNAGATVLATASSDEKLERLKELGLDHGINYATESFVERARELTEGKGVNLILDSVGGQTLKDGISALAFRGRIVSVGVAGRSGSAIEARALWANNNSLHGVFLGGLFLPEYPRVRAMIEDLLKRLDAGEYRVIIDRTFPLSQAAAAHEYIESRHAFGRVVLAP